MIAVRTLGFIFTLWALALAYAHYTGVIIP